MQKIHMIKIISLILFLNLNYFSFSADSRYTVKSSEERISYLVSLIEKKLNQSDVLDRFVKEQKIWTEYKQSHLETLFPDTINNIEMKWGSIISQEMGEEILKLNLERINILEAYLNRNGETGTDGSGIFMDYVIELDMMKKNQKSRCAY